MIQLMSSTRLSARLVREKASKNETSKQQNNQTKASKNGRGADVKTQLRAECKVKERQRDVQSRHNVVSMGINNGTERLRSHLMPLDRAVITSAFWAGTTTATTAAVTAATTAATAATTNVNNGR